VKDLVSLLVESHQEVPPWMEQLAYKTPQVTGGRKPLNKRYVVFWLSLPVDLMKLFRRCANEVPGI